MASHISDSLKCSICLDIFNDPVILPCSHSFCCGCMQQWKEKGHRTCPVCRIEFISIDACVNLALKNVCEGIVQASLGSEDICSLHKETLKLFCLDHQELVCTVCLHAQNHAGHKFRPLEDVVDGHKEDLKKGLQDAKERLTYSRKMKDDCGEQAASLKVQRERVEGIHWMAFPQSWDSHCHCCPCNLTKSDVCSS
uniref:RING-type domain-containing protein n=1 Tax=Hippocampus comes TaxID=109280 RepID=A0A3Q2XUY8_HIPCM